MRQLKTKTALKQPSVDISHLTSANVKRVVMLAMITERHLYFMKAVCGKFERVKATFNKNVKGSFFHLFLCVSCVA